MLKQESVSGDATAYVLRELLAEAEEPGLQSKLIAATLDPGVDADKLLEVVMDVG